MQHTFRSFQFSSTNETKSTSGVSHSVSHNEILHSKQKRNNGNERNLEVGPWLVIIPRIDTKLRYLPSPTDQVINSLPHLFEVTYVLHSLVRCTKTF